MGQARWIPRAVLSICLASCALIFSGSGQTADQLTPDLGQASITSSRPLVTEYHGSIASPDKSVVKVHSTNSGGIREQVPANMRLGTSSGSRSFWPPTQAGSNGPPIKTIQTSLSQWL